MDDLNRIFGELTRSVPDGPEDEADFIFDKSVLPIPPCKLSSERVVFRKSGTCWNGDWHRTEVLQLFVEPDAARELGVFLLACAFHDPESATLELPASSEIRRLIYRSPMRNVPGSVPSGLRMIPATFRYWPTRVAKHPWLGETNVRSLPLLALSSLEECAVTEQQWAARDTVFVASSCEGTVRLAELLLNAGCSWNTVREFQLEGDAGFRGVAPLSADLSIYLPGSFPWVTHPDPVLAER